MKNLTDFYKPSDDVDSLDDLEQFNDSINKDIDEQDEPVVALNF